MFGASMGRSILENTKMSIYFSTADASGAAKSSKIRWKALAIKAFLAKVRVPACPDAMSSK
jgi:hypothetical protein